MHIKNYLCIIIFVLAWLQYGNTLSNQYVRDDYDLIVNNSQVKKGLSSPVEIFTSKLRDGSSAVKNELYRPITKFVYALQWDIAENNPMVGHFINVLFFALLCVLVFLVALHLFQGSFIFSFLATLFFIVHPIHTEVVANIKSIDEILALLFFLGAMLLLSRYFQSGKQQHLAFAVLVYGLSLFSKESAVTFFALIPLYIFYTRKYKAKQIFITCLYFLVPLIMFLMIRSRVMHDYNHSKTIARIDNYLIIANLPGQKLATCIYLLGNYLKMLFIPYPLVCDYSYHHFPVVSFSNPVVLITTLLLVGLLFFVIKKFRSGNMIAFSIAWFFISIAVASNIFYLIGTNFGERLLFAPSIAFCIFITYIILRINHPKLSYAITLKDLKGKFMLNLIAMLVICVTFSVITFNRNKEWKDDMTLASADVKKNPESARLHLYMAGELQNEIIRSKNSDSVQKQNLPQIKKQLDEAVRIYPDYGSAHFSLGEYYMHIEETQKAISELNYALLFLSRSPRVYNDVSLCMLELNYPDSALMYVNAGLKIAPGYPDLIAKYGGVLLCKNKPDSAIYFLEQSVKTNANNGWAFKQLSKAYVMKKDSAKSRYYKKLAAEKGF